MASEIPTNLLIIIIFHFSDIFIYLIIKYLIVNNILYKKYCRQAENELKRLLLI